MGSIPTLVTRILACLVVLGLLAGAQPGRILQPGDPTHTQFATSDGLPKAFVAVLDSTAQTPTSLQLLKVSSPVALPSATKLTLPRITRLEKNLCTRVGLRIHGRNTLVGVVELRL